MAENGKKTETELADVVVTTAESPKGGKMEACHEGQADHAHFGDGALRAAVFGFSDGLVSNVSLILGVAGANVSNSNVVMTGLAGLLAGAASMSCGEYISMRIQAESLKGQLDLEADHLKRYPEQENAELVQFLEGLGVANDTACKVIADISKLPDKDKHMLNLHARFEMGIDPDELGSPWKAAGFSYAAFAVGAIVPLWPWMAFKERQTAFIVSIVLSIVAAIVVGYLLGKGDVRAKLWGGARQVLVGLIAAASTYAIGAAIGESVL